MQEVRSPAETTQRTAHAERGPRSASPGTFDYYLFTLSWSPEFCYSHRDSPECSANAPKGFVVHGLWPQNNNGSYPENCSTAPGLSNADSMLDIMPDPRLVQHEWTTHGTCTGLNAADYFAQIRAAYNALAIPQPLKTPTRTLQLNPADLKNDFVESNPSLEAADLKIGCGHGRNYLVQVQVCMSKTLKPIACPALQDCAASVVTVAGVS